MNILINLRLAAPLLYLEKSSATNLSLRSNHLQRSHRFAILSASRPPLTMASKKDGTDSINHLPRLRKQQQQFQLDKTQFFSPTKGLWNGFVAGATVQELIESMERTMGDPFGYPPCFRDASRSRGRTPWETKECGEEFRLRFDMPGMTMNDVKVWVNERVLVIKAKKQRNGNESSPAKSSIRYDGRMSLPENVEVGNIKTQVKDGVLYIIIPKTRLCLHSRLSQD